MGNAHSKDASRNKERRGGNIYILRLIIDLVNSLVVLNDGIVMFLETSIKHFQHILHTG